MQIDRCRLVVEVLAAVMMMLVFASTTFADDFQPLYVEIGVSGNGDVIARVKPPPGRPQYELVTLGLPEFCASTENAQTTGLILRYSCTAPIDGATLRLLYPEYLTPMPAVVRINYTDGGHDGGQQVLTLPVHDQTWTQPKPAEHRGVALQYSILGVEHIWIGYDHLLFLLCVIWIAGTGKRILLMVTGFTIAHSVTLALATFDVVSLNIAWVETVIALSVLFLALEVTRNRRHTLTWRYPATISTLFGLLHGFGFASVLAEIGLPAEERLKGLLFFNLGVEIGQLLFIAASVLIYRALKTLLKKHEWRSGELSPQLVGGYFIGCISAFWFIERMVNLSSLNTG